MTEPKLLEDAAVIVITITNARLAVKRLPPSREQAIIVTKLDEAHLWLERLVALEMVKLSPTEDVG